MGSLVDAAVMCAWLKISSIGAPTARYWKEWNKSSSSAVISLGQYLRLEPGGNRVVGFSKNYWLGSCSST